AEIENILTFSTRRPDAISIELTRNFRSNASIELMARRLMQDDPSPIGLDEFLLNSNAMQGTKPVQFHHID
ncbi:hypothetical protein, partial [Klebsiella aerogenes]|uniref:hypothetical protein n=1 Tax=Klebsiella aerogenes TaxID=548 RepID=UPI0013CF4ACE